MVAQKLEASFLGEYTLILVDRTISEAKDQVVCEAISLCDLCHLTIRKLLAFQCAQRKKAMHQAFLVTHMYLLSGQPVWLEQDGANQQDGERTEGVRYENGKTPVQSPKHFDAHFFDAHFISEERQERRQREQSTKKRGIAVVRSAAMNVTVLGAGGTKLRVGEGKDSYLLADFDWMNEWYVEDKQTAAKELGSDVARSMKGEGIVVAKSESASALVFWNGKTWLWRQIGD